MLDFYADWCVSCKEMEKYTFTDGDVINALANTRLLQADVTANDEIDQALLQKHFGLPGPPAIIFYGADGVERKGFRVVGFVPADEFASHVREAIR
jgi:thiol:disulfide interchange protein DsbD